MDMVACQMAARALYEADRNPNDPHWDELPINNQASRTAAVMRVARAYVQARVEKRIQRAKRKP